MCQRMEGKWNQSLIAVFLKLEIRGKQKQTANRWSRPIEINTTTPTLEGGDRISRPSQCYYYYQLFRVVWI